MRATCGDPTRPHDGYTDAVMEIIDTSSTGFAHQNNYRNPKTMIRCLSYALLRCFIGFALISSRSFANDTFNPVYSAYGILKYQNINQSNDVDFEEIWLFGIQEDNVGRWKAELHTQLPVASMPLKADQYVSYDGTNIYSILYSPDRVVTTLNEPTRIVPGNDQHAAQISTGPYPLDYSGVGGMLWLAFIGGNNLDAASSQTKFPDLTVADPRQDPGAWSCDFEYKLINSKLRPLIYSGRFILNKKYIPESGRFYSEIDDPADEKHFEQRERLLKKLRDLDQDILTRSTYSVDETNDLNGVIVPAKFHFDIFSLDHSGAHNHLEGVITNLVVGSPSNLMPKLSGLVTVQDRRLRVKTPDSFRLAVLYNLGNDGWIVDTNDARIQAIAASRRPVPTIMVAHRPLYYRWSIAFFIVILLAPLMVLFRRKKID